MVRWYGMLEYYAGMIRWYGVYWYGVYWFDILRFVCWEGLVSKEDKPVWRLLVILITAET